MKVKRHLLLVTLLCTTLNACQQESKVEKEVTPLVEDQKESAVEEDVVECQTKKDFVDEGWLIVSEAKGDLNKDGIEDLAMVIQDDDPSLIEKDEYMQCDHNPRTLIILFGTEDKCYSLAERSTTFIPTHEDMFMADPFDNMEIKNGTLRFGFVQFATMGTWETTSYQYIWRYQEGAFRLIGASSSFYHRATGDASDVSINFSTKKYSVTNYIKFEEDEQKETTWHTFSLKELKTFATFTNPMGWEMVDGIYI